MMRKMTLKIELSEAMRARIAAGEVDATEAQVKRNTHVLVQHLCGGLPDWEAPFRELSAAIKSGWVDGQAMCLYQDKVLDVKVPLLHTLIRHQMDEHRDDQLLIDWVVNQNAPDLKDADGVPAFEAALGQGCDKRYWETISRRPDCDVEQSYACTRMVELPYKIMPFDFQGSLLNQKCQEVMLVKNMQGYAGHWSVANRRYDGRRLIEAGAILNPHNLDALKDMDMWAHKWQSQYVQLESAIEAKDKKAVDAAIAAGAVGRGFSMGHGEQLCRAEFWGPFWEEGQQALLSLPDWAQHQLIMELMPMLKEQLPKPIGWTERISGETTKNSTAIQGR